MNNLLQQDTVTDAQGSELDQIKIIKICEILLTMIALRRTVANDSDRRDRTIMPSWTLCTYALHFQFSCQAAIWRFDSKPTEVLLLSIGRRPVVDSHQGLVAHLVVNFQVPLLSLPSWQVPGPP